MVINYNRLFVCLSVCVSVPSKPENYAYVSSTENSLTVSWQQSGAIDRYIIEYNNTQTESVSFTGVDSNVSATVHDLPTSGAYYCITVTAVSGHLHSDNVTLCNYTGEWLFCFCRLTINIVKGSVLFSCTKVDGLLLPAQYSWPTSFVYDISGQTKPRSHYTNWTELNIHFAFQLKLKMTNASIYLFFKYWWI